MSYQTAMKLVKMLTFYQDNSGTNKKARTFVKDLKTWVSVNNYYNGLIKSNVSKSMSHEYIKERNLLIDLQKNEIKQCVIF